jgi:hypothetical protein
MPKKKLTVQAGITINLGNYESARIDYGIEDVVSVESDEDLQKAFDERTKLLGKMVNQKKKAILKSRGFDME